MKKSSFILRNWSRDMREKNVGHWKFAWLSKILREKCRFSHKRNRW